MSPLAAAFLVAAMVTVSKWSEGKQLDITNIMGMAGVAVGLTIVGSINKDLGRAFAVLIVVSVALFQLPDLLPQFKNTGKGTQYTPPIRRNGGSV